MSLLALAFADNGIQCLVDPFTLVIMHFKEALAIQWKLEPPEHLLPRGQVNGKISDSEPWTAMDLNYCLKKFRPLSGYPQSLSSSSV